MFQVKSEERVVGKVELEAKPSRYSYPKQVFILFERIVNTVAFTQTFSTNCPPAFQPSSRNGESEAGRVSYEVNGVSRLMEIQLNLYLVDINLRA